jgi:hypothetical protein
LKVEALRAEGIVRAVLDLNESKVFRDADMI